ncbi:hypothetical protein [Ideonella sp.]|uniref:hypothetical protein n=1 Tax=Ideonella sp. TaxID=1929293 RepID=UPI0035AF09CB
MNKVAVVVLHGVADQSPGDTLESVASLLVAATPGARYERRATQALTLAVPPVPPGVGGADPGITLTDRLLGASARASTAYRTHRVRLQRSDAGGTARVDLFEMYWADLSRLSGSVPRIVSEVFTLIFRLSRLGVEAVGARAAAQPDARWRALHRLHELLDAAMVYLIAPLTMVLGLFGLLIMGLGAVAALDAAGQRLLARSGLLLVAAGAAWWALYRTPADAPAWRPHRHWLPLAGALAWAVAGWGAAHPVHVPMAIMAAAAGALYLGALNVAARRFRFDLRLATAPAVLIGATTCLVALNAAPGDAAGWMRVAIAGLELALLGIKYTWFLICGLAVGVMAVGVWICWRDRHDYGAIGSLGTARLGSMLSIVSFVLVTSMLWAAVSAGIGLAARGVPYRPIAFPLSTLPADRHAQVPPAAGAWPGAVPPHVEVRRCEALQEATREAEPGQRVTRRECLQAAELRARWQPCTAPAPPDVPVQYLTRCAVCAGCDLPVLHGSRAALQGYVYADAFLQDRYEQSTLVFGPVAVLVLLLSAWAIALLTPSAVAEAARPDAATPHSSAALGRWLTRGFRFADRLTAALVVAGAGMSALVMLWFTDTALSDQLQAALRASVGDPSDTIGQLSRSLLGPFIISAASVGAVLVLFGGVLSRVLPAIRGPLDVVLDVDNYLRDFSADSLGGVPRAKIFDRMAALWDQVADYDHVVVVAHSQGTVIAADFLRWKRHHTPADAAWPRIELVSFGSPLRQLYAARFPVWYGWVLQPHPAPADSGTAASPWTTGPGLDGLGIVRWTNAYCSGDYVGRWLWTAGAAPDPRRGHPGVGHPLADAVLPAAAPRWPRPDAYAPYDRATWRAADPRRPDWPSRLDVCLGYGAHTRYFDVGSRSAAWLIDAAVARGAGRRAP